MFTVTHNAHPATGTAASFTAAAGVASALYGECYLVSESNGTLVFGALTCECGDCDACDED